MLWGDTAEQEGHDQLKPLFRPDMDVLLMCFFIDYVCSIENLPEKWNVEIKRFRTNVYIMLAGNKNSLLKDEYMRWELAKVKQQSINPDKFLEIWQLGVAFWVYKVFRKNKGRMREFF